MPESLEQAATLAFALLRFETGAGNESLAGAAPDDVLGRDAFIFLPVVRRVGYADVVPYLAACPSPAILVPSSTRGMVALLLLSELTDDRRRWAENLFQDYRNSLRAAADRLGLTPASSIVFEFDDEAHDFSFATLSLCCERFIVQVAFNLDPMLYDDPRAMVRLNAIRSDGVRSFGSACGSRYPTMTRTPHN